MKNALLNFLKSFLSNLKNIIFALVLAIIVWLAVSFRMFPDITRTIAVPLSLETTEYMQDINLELVEKVDEIINVSIEGKRNEIAGLTEEDFEAYLDFSTVRAPGVYDVAVVIRSLADENTAYLKAGSNNVKRTVTIIQRAEKTIRTTPYLEDVTVGGGLSIEYADISVNPESVIISGEKSLIDAVYDVRINVSSVQPLSSTVTLEGEPVFLDSKGEILSSEGIYIEDRAFTVTIPISKRKTLPLEVTIINAPENFDLDLLYSKISIEPAELTIASPDESIDNLDVWNLGTISLDDITFGNLESGLPVQITLPDGYSNVSGNNVATLHFDSGGYGVVEFNIPRSNFNHVNLPAGYSVEYVTRMIPVKVVGPSSIIHSMSPSDINGTINFAGIADISSGERSIGVKFAVAGTDVSAWVVGEDKIDIIISQ